MSYQQEINEYNVEQAKRYELIGKLQQQSIDLSYSWAKEMLKSPSHFINHKLREREPQTEAMIFGSLVDCLITEPDNLKTNFVVVDKIPSTEAQKTFCNEIIKGALLAEAFNIAYKRGNADDLYNDFKPYINAIINKQSTITTELLNEAENIAKILTEDKSISLMLDSANSFQTKSVVKYEGWNIKRFTDVQGVGVTIDLKLMSKLNPTYIDKEIFTMDYDLQSAIYTLDNKDNFFNICYDRKGNSLIAEYDDSVFRYGREKLDYILDCLYRCCENPYLFSESYNFHDIYNEKLGLKTKKIYKPGYLKSYR